MPIEPPTIPVDKLVTSGEYRTDGGDPDIEANVWMVGNDRTAVVVDPAHDPTGIALALGDRELVAIVCTHGHRGHVNAAVTLADLTDAPILLHPDDEPLWERAHPGRQPDAPLLHDERLQAGDIELQVRHVPGHTAGAVALYAPEIDVVFTGDTLPLGGPGQDHRIHTDVATLVASISERLLTLPSATVVHPGHGESTTIGAEAPRVTAWLPAR